MRPSDTLNLSETTRASDTVLTFYSDDIGSELRYYDTVLSFDVSGSNGANNDRLDLPSAQIAANASHVNGLDSGNLAQHSISAGILKFEDASGNAILINTSNLNDATRYLELNLTTPGQPLAFEADTDSNVGVDSLFVYENTGRFEDSILIKLAGVTEVTLGNAAGQSVVQIVDSSGPSPDNATLTSNGVTIDFSETVASADFSGITLQKGNGGSTLSAMAVTSVTPVGNQVTIATNTTLGANDYVLLTLNDATHQYTVDNLGNRADLFEDRTGAFAGNGGANINLSGLAGKFFIAGGAGNDTLTANNNGSKLEGGAGNDTLIGGAGKDGLKGGEGADTLNGGAGADEFKFGQGDSTPVIFADNGGTGVSNGDIYTFSSGADIIEGSGFTVTGPNGDHLGIWGDGHGVSKMSSLPANGLVADQSYFLTRGAFYADVFTVNSSGADTLIVYDGNGDISSVSQTALVLQGVNPTQLTASSWGDIYLNTSTSTGTSLAISSATSNGSISEGNSGSTTVGFQVSRSGDTSGSTSVNWSVVAPSGSTVNTADFAGGVFASGTVSFAAGETLNTLSVQVLADTIAEPDDVFGVRLTNPTGGASLSFAETQVWIRNDDGNVNQAPTFNLFTPDLSFSNDGWLTTDFAGEDSVGQIARLTDGQILLVGETGQEVHYANGNIGWEFGFALALYNADGSLDTRFAGDGKLTTQLPDRNLWANDAFQQADGKILVAGNSLEGVYDNNGTWVGFDHDVVLARYNTDGSLDSSFGSNGVVITDFASEERATDIVQLADGSILVSGHINDRDNEGSLPEEYFVLRYAADGHLDTTFGVNGVADWGTESDAMLHFGVLANGQVLRIFKTYSSTLENPTLDYLAQYNLDGNLDTSYGVNGHVDLGAINVGGGHIQPNGELLLIAETTDPTNGQISHTLLHYLASGERLNAFNFDLNLDSWLDYGYGSTVEDLVLLPGGQLLLTGEVMNTNNRDFGLFRFNIANLPDQHIPTGEDIAYSMPNGIFTDPDDGDTLTYSLQPAPDAVVPNWITINPTTGNLSGTPTGEAGEIGLKVVATDSSGALAKSNEFLLSWEAGTTVDPIIRGTDNPDMLDGTSGADTIDGGLGIDTLIGGAGDDNYIVTLGDILKEKVNSGVDLVLSNINWTLAVYVENLTLTGTAAINGTGNDAANLLTGNDAANKLMGLAGIDILLGGDGADTLDGGLGADLLTGGNGNDTYIVDSLGDVIGELASAGTDVVNASISYALLNNIENLTLTGSTAIIATGNAGNNKLTGNSAANQLFGLDGKDSLNGGLGNDTLDGGSGADTMTGGEGNDTYWVDNNLDVINEVNNQGSDLVKAKISYTLGNTLENLTLTGTAAINATGNTGNNTLTGNDAANKIFGNAGADALLGLAGADILTGGAGNDTLTGGAGKDIFVFDSLLGFDTIKDFKPIDDTLHLEKDVFTALKLGVLTSSAFAKGVGLTQALDALDRIIYNTTTGDLYYDADGTGTTSPAVLIGTLSSTATTHPSLGLADIVVV